MWTSGAHYSDIGEIIARTDPDLPKHKGLTGFVVDMKAPGVEIRPLRQMTGGATFNEVFFTEVRVPDDHRLGDVNNGWNVALTTLMNERAAIGGGGGRRRRADDPRLIEMVRHFGLDTDPLVRQGLADLIIHSRVVELHQPAGHGPDQGRSAARPGDEHRQARRRAEHHAGWSSSSSEVLGAELIADTGEWGTFAWGQLVLGNPGGHIAGGTDEIMKNIVGERVLGLPKDPGIDVTSAFKDIKVGTQKA